MSLNRSQQLNLPLKLRPLISSELHVKIAQLGVNCTVQLIKDRFYWPGMADDVAHFISKACWCLKKKTPVRIDVVLLQSILTSASMELMCLDFLYLDQGGGWCECVLVVTDYFSRWTQAYATQNKKYKTAAECLLNDFILRHRMPSNILHDQGGKFENGLVKESGNGGAGITWKVLIFAIFEHFCEIL